MLQLTVLFCNPLAMSIAISNETLLDDKRTLIAME